MTLTAVNAAITPKLFTLDYSHEMGSIEAAFIGLARYIRDHFPHLSWFPLWYGGIPYADSYPPLLHWIVALAAAGHLSPGLAYHGVTAVVYVLGPAALFWAAWRLGASRAAAFTAALGYSLISPACFLVRDIRVDAGGWFGPRRLVALVRYGEGPHLLSLLLLPVALGMVHVALEKRRPQYWFGAALALAAVVLSNWLGSFALALMIAAYLLARWERRSWIAAAALSAWAYAIAMPWISPSTIATIRANAPLVGGKFESGLGQKIFAVSLAVGLVALAWAMRRIKVPGPCRFAVLFLVATATITLSAYWFHFSLVPQPFRYHLEMDLAFWLAVALCLPLLPRSAGRIACAAAVLALPIAIHQHRLAGRMEQPIAIESTVEYRISRYLGQHLPGRRVFAPGTIGFWMNAFSDTPMLTGGFDNGIRNTFLRDVIYQIYFGDQQKVAVDWLKAFGVEAVVGGGPQSREVYHPYNHPEKLRGLPESWREAGDVIYAVPGASHSLAHAVLPADLPTVRPPAYDTAPLARYLAALDDPARPAASFRWLDIGRGEIRANLEQRDWLSIQETWDAGWRALVNGQSRRVWGDKLGQIVVEPRCSGPCTVVLEWDGGAEMAVARVLSMGAVLFGIVWTFLWQRRLVSQKTN